MDTFVPTIAVADPTDARIVFDALNNYYMNLPAGDMRERAVKLLIAVHADTIRTDTETGNES